MGCVRGARQLEFTRSRLTPRKLGVCTRGRLSVPRSSALRGGVLQDTPQRSAALRLAAHIQLVPQGRSGALRSSLGEVSSHKEGEFCGLSSCITWYFLLDTFYLSLSAF